MDKLFLDTNFLLDLAIEERPEGAEAAALFDMIAEREVLAAVSASSLKDFYYIARKDIEERLRRDWITLYLDTFDTAPLDCEICRDAICSYEPDFEDAIILKTAEQGGCNYIISRDEAAFKSSQIPKMTATEYLGSRRADGDTLGNDLLL